MTAARPPEGARSAAQDSPAPLRIAIAGASGRMGRMLVEAVLDAPDCALAGALDVEGSPALGQDAGGFLGRSTGVAITPDLGAALADAQILIDFTRPEGTLRHLGACADKGVGLVIGTTGFTDAHKAEIRALSARTAVFMAPNMSVGVNVVMRLIEQAARALSQGYDIEIIEAHHRHKVDAPSGTALRLGELVASAQGRTLAQAAVHTRHGVTGPRPQGAVGFSVIRGGDLVGDHTVLFAGTGERIEITHRACSRLTYALGALRAARFLAQREAGLYEMRDVLGLG